MPLTLDHIDLVVADVQASVEFYRRLGVDIPDEAVWAQNGDTHHVEVVLPNGLRLGIDSIAMTKGYDPGWEQAEGGRNIFIFSAPNREAVDEIFGRMIAAGYESYKEPFDVFWGARYAILNDPDGNHVGVMSPSDPERHTSPPGI